MTNIYSVKINPNGRDENTKLKLKQVFESESRCSSFLSQYDDGEDMIVCELSEQELSGLKNCGISLWEGEELLEFSSIKSKKESKNYVKWIRAIKYTFIIFVICALMLFLIHCLVIAPDFIQLGFVFACVFVGIVVWIKYAFLDCIEDGCRKENSVIPITEAQLEAGHNNPIIKEWCR